MTDSTWIWWLSLKGYKIMPFSPHFYTPAVKCIISAFSWEYAQFINEVAKSHSSYLDCAAAHPISNTEWNTKKVSSTANFTSPWKLKPVGVSSVVTMHQNT